MSRNYDNWVKLVGAVLRREKDRQLAYCESFSTSSSVSTSSRHKFDPTDPSSENVFLSHDVKAIEFEEIRKATKNFRRDWCLGEGRFGPVFKGHMSSGIAVAVKKLNYEGFQVHDEWVEEINYLSQLHHPNLVQLIGYSIRNDYTSNRFLVYEFMPKGNLANHLFAGRPESLPWVTRMKVAVESLPWATRMKVAVGAARAVAFLHGLEIPVIHGNINSGHILLDADFNAKLSGIGLPKHLSIHKKVGDMYGPYAAPEYRATGHLSTECDVYSFGVVLVELITGRRALDRNRLAREHYLMHWVKPYLVQRRTLLQIMDTRLEGKYPHEDAYKVGQIALQCVSSNRRSRPRMAEVVAVLQQL